MKKATLLIVEDNVVLSNTLTNHCKRFYSVAQAPTLQAATALIAEKTFDLVLLDRTLPDGDGAELIELLNSHSPTTKVCVISTKTEMSDRVFGLNRGADAYLPKPFQPQELQALLRALLRRGNLTQESILRCGSIQLHLGPNVLQREQQQVALTPRETEFLQLFFQSTSRYLTQQQIRDWFWKNNLEASASHIHVFAQRARKKLKQIRGTIVAHYGTGYELKILE